MTIKLGNTEINAVSVIEPYGDDLAVVADEPLEPWVRPSHWLDMPVINSGEQKCAILFAVASGETLDNYFKITAYGIDPPGTVHTDFNIDWGDGNTYYCNVARSRYAADPSESTEHKFEFDNLNPDTQFEDNGTLYRQSLIQFDAPLSGIQHFYFKLDKNYTGGYRVNPRNILEYNINLPQVLQIGGNIYGYNTRNDLIEKARLYTPLVSNLAHYFNDAKRLRSVEFGPFNNLTEVRGLFRDCESLDTVPSIDTSNATVVGGIFQNTGLTEYNNELDFSGSTDWSSLFYNCRKLKKAYINIPSGVTRTTSMFSQCRNLVSVSGNWDFSTVVDCQNTFYQCDSVVRVPDINFSNVNNARWTFNGCISLNQPITLNAPNLTNGESMFSNCRSMTSLTIEDLSGANSPRINSMFSSCHSLKNLKIINPNIKGDSSYGLNGLFAGCIGLEYVPHINASGNTRVDSMFSDCTSLKEVKKIDTPDCTNFSAMFYNCKRLKKQGVYDITANGTGDVITYRMFYACNDLEQIPNFDYSRVYHAREMFISVLATGVIGTLDLSNMNRETSTDSNKAYAMFQSCQFEKIENLILPLSGQFNSTFSACKLKSIPYISVPSGYYYGNTFNNCYNLTQGALSGINVSIGYYRTNLPSGEIYKLFDGLASGVVGQTVDLRETPEAYILHPDTIAIATSKGWTVTT